MSAFEAIVMGIVQGLTEFLPVSSSGHLRIVPAFLGWEDPGAAFTAVVQLGTMLAVLVYFRKDLWNVTKALLAGVTSSSARRAPEFKLGLYIIVGTIPISILGLLFSHQIETTARSLYVIGTTLIVLGLVLLIAERVGKRQRDIDKLTTKDAVLFGLAQSLALIPGVSRSGATITAGLFLGFDRAAAARYSFLLSVPAVVLSGLYQLKDISEGGGAGVGATVIATVLAFIVGWISIAALLKFLVNHSTSIFVGYRVALGVLVIVLAATGTIS